MQFFLAETCLGDKVPAYLVLRLYNGDLDSFTLRTLFRYPFDLIQASVELMIVWMGPTICLRLGDSLAAARHLYN